MSRRRGARAGALVAALAIVAAALVWGERLAGDARVLRARSVEARGFGAGGLGRLLRRLELVHALPPRVVPASDPSGLDLLSHTFDRPVEYALDPLPRGRVAEALAIDPGWLERDVVVVSLLLRPEDLEGLAGNPDGRGREAQRRAYLGYVANGEYRFGSFVGIRPHGGSARGFPFRYRGFRVYFRNRYGHDRFPVPLFADRERRPSELVLRHAGGPLPSGEHRYFTSELGYDIARRAGVPAPQTRLALLYVNGLPMGVRALTEFIQRDFLTARFGMREPVLVRTKIGAWDRGEQTRLGDAELHRRLLDRLRSAEVERGWIRANVDVDNLYRWCVAVLFCETGDVFQGALVRDLAAPGGRWFWIAWDLDESFGIGWERHPEPFRVLLGNGRDARTWALRRLLADGGERRAFLALAAEVLNHRLTEEFLDARWRYYRDQAAALGLAEEARVPLARIRAFLKGRGSRLLAELAGQLGDGRLHRVEVSAPSGRRLRIDGHLRDTPYRGAYAGGLEIDLAVPAGERRGFSHWRVDGRDEAAPELTLAVDRDLTIEAVFTGGALAARARRRGATRGSVLEPGQAAAAAAQIVEGAGLFE